MTPVSVLVMCLAALVVLQPGSALRCWNCNDYACDEAVRSGARFSITDCERDQPAPYYGGYANPAYSVCRKIKQRGPDGRTSTIRDCAWVNPQDGGRSACSSHQLTPGYVHQEYCSICNTDLCNSAPRPNVPLAAVLAAPLVAVAAWMRH